MKKDDALSRRRFAGRLNGFACPISMEKAVKDICQGEGVEQSELMRHIVQFFLDRGYKKSVDDQPNTGRVTTGTDARKAGGSARGAKRGGVRAKSGRGKGGKR